jgi:hypothetical protein
MSELGASRWRQLAWLAAGLAAAASLAFALASPAHVEDGWEYRGFFLVVAMVEMALAVWLIVWAWGRGTLTERDRGVLRRATVIGAIAATAGIVVYFAMLATGVQHAGHSPEAVAAGPAPLDVATRVIELALVAALIRLGMLTSGHEEATVS